MVRAALAYALGIATIVALQHTWRGFFVWALSRGDT